MKRLLLFVAVAVLALSCEQETELSLTSDVPSYVFEADGGEFDTIIFTNGSWTATCDDPAVSFTPNEGDYSQPMHIKVGSNEEQFTKVIRITLNSKLNTTSRTGRIVITQLCRPFIVCEEPCRQIGPEGGIVRFTVNSNKSWQAWHQSTPACAVEPVHGGPNLTEVSLLIPSNPDGVQRDFVVRLVLDGAADTYVDLVVEQGA